MSKHTPGPWKVGTPPPNGEQTIGTLGGLMVAVATTGAGIQTETNARLIAAAPDMLDMLKECHDALEYVGSWETPVGLIERVRDLIQKVEGDDATE